MCAKQPDPVLQAWRETAPYWEKHWRTIQTMLAQVTRAIIEAAHIAGGQSVLDVAGGTGEPSLTIAEMVGPSGSVTCTDVVAEMISAAQRGAGRRNLTNVEFLQCAAENLPFGNNRFDAVTCRFGAMFFSDPPAALGQMLRVTKPGGRLSLAVWHAREFNPFFAIVAEIMSRYVEAPPEDSNAPGAFRFAELGKLASLLSQAGSVQTSETVLKFRIQAPVSLPEFWPLRVEMSDTLREKVGRLTAEQLSRVAQEVQSAASSFFPDGRMDFPAQVIIVTREKPD